MLISVWLSDSSRRIVAKFFYLSDCFINFELIHLIEKSLFDQRILNPDDMKLLPHITDCETKLYVVISLDVLSHVSIYALFCSNLTLLFPLIRTPIVTIQWYYEKGLGL